MTGWRAAEDDEAQDEATDDAAAEDDAVEPEDGITCPDVAPEDTPESFEISAVINVIWGTPAAPYISATLCRYDPPFEWATLWGSTDDCRMRLLHPWTVPSAVALDAGEVTVEIDGTPLGLVPMHPSMPCFLQADGTVPEPTPGGTIRAWSTGGADIAAFDLSLTFPETLPEFTTPAAGETLLTCTPWTFAWEPTDLTDVWVQMRRLLPDDSEFEITCRPLSRSPVVLPAELTALWHPDLDGASVWVGVEPQVTSTTDPPVTLGISYSGEAAHRSVSVARP
ncbi:MAG: hypothetical protein JXB32_17565 [Deltaproteobacteria bacterium]|nr:hypothetical protein [Deltaproteobacteria bacterium]